MTHPKLIVLATGGTIAGQAGNALRRDYRPGQISIGDFLKSAAPLCPDIRLEGRQIANIGSEDMDWAILTRLHSEIMQAIADDNCAGIIVTHGTDTAEESAFLLDQTLPTSKPVVIVGAMLPANAVGSDGLRNFACAAQAAADERSAGRGVLLVMGSMVLAARDARKSRTLGAEAFSAFPRGPVAMVTPSSVEWFQDPWRTQENARFTWPETPPLVAIIHAHAGMHPDCVQSAIDGGARGIVLAGFGAGNAPTAIRRALASAVAAGVPVVRSSRVDEGLVDPEPDDAENNFIAARALGPAKARILLQLLIANGITDVAACQAEFGRR